MFSPCGTESTCPSDLRLILEPAEVIEEYEQSLTVTCSSTVKEDETIYWRVGNINFDDDWDSVSLNLTLSEYNMDVQCRLKLNESYECNEDLGITVYKTPEVVSSIKHVSYTGEETQYDLQCDIFNVAPVQNLVVKLYKNNETIMTGEFNDSTKTPVNETIILPINISRSEGVVQLRCEAQLDFGQGRVQLPVVVSQTHNTSALYAPEMNPENHIEEISVSEGENVTLNCDAEGNPPPVFSWTCGGEDLMEKTNNLTFAPVNATTICVCTTTNHLGNRTKQYHIEMNVTVITYTPIITTPKAQTPRGCPLMVMPPKIVARFGDSVLAVCNTSATDAEGMGWESPVQGTGFGPPPSVNLAIEKLEDWGIQPFCYITLTDGSQCSVVLPIEMYKTPDMVLVDGPDQDLIEGIEYQLKCYISNVAPTEKLKVLWYKDNEVYQTRNFSQTSQTPVSETITLSFTPTRDNNGSVFRCEAVLDFGPDGPEIFPTRSPNYTAVVQYKPLFKSCPSHHSVGEDEFRLDMFHCQIDGNPPPTVQWYHDGEVFDSSKALTRNDTGKYTVEIKNIHGNRNSSVDITVEYGPSFACLERYEIEMTTDIQTLCEPEGLPSPTLTWFKDGKEKVQWTKRDSGEYEIEAENKHGTAKRKVYLDILYTPEIKEGNHSVEVTQGDNVTLECNAEGNPPPEVVWAFTPPDVTPGTNTKWSHKTLTVTAATSTSAGVYSCTATNRVGKVTRTVSLAIKGKSRGFPIAVIWVLILILTILAFILLVVFFHKRQKKHGQYSFIPSKSGSDIPLSSRATEGSP